MDELTFKSYLWKADLHGAVNYLKQFDNQQERIEQYHSIFEEGNYLTRSDNPVINEIDYLYQDYYRNVFWKKMCPNKSAKILSHSLKALRGPCVFVYPQKIVKRLIESQDYHCFLGETQGYYGPYIWENTTEKTFRVDLPSGRESFTIKLLDGFVSRSWLDFISFGLTGTGGWADESGTLYCVRKLYDMESDDFKISYLKHEAQHAYDMRIFVNLSKIDLEYRAKLVELIYYPTPDVLTRLYHEADNTHPENSHAMASFLIIEALSHRLQTRNLIEQFENVKKVAQVLLEENTHTLEKR